MNLDNKELLEQLKACMARAERAEQKLLLSGRFEMDVMPALLSALAAVELAIASAYDAARAAECLPSVDVALVEEVTK